MSAEDVKAEIDAQSGRFEFLKQALTLGLAGLAGTAAIFTDATKIPSEAGALVAACLIGLALLALVWCSLSGLSAYANLLKAHGEDQAVTIFRKSMIMHARAVFGCVLATALGFVVFAGAQVSHRSDRSVTAVGAIGIARSARTAAGCQALFEGVERRGDAFRLTFRSAACGRGFVVTVGTADGAVAVRPAS